MFLRVSLCVFFTRRDDFLLPGSVKQISVVFNCNCLVKIQLLKERGLSKYFGPLDNDLLACPI